MRRAALVFALSIAVGACATTMNWQATGGSRSDGTVRLSFEYGAFQRPRLDENQATTLAAQRCRVWGYQGAEAFGAGTQTCEAQNGYGCMRWLVTKEYQCTGAHAPAAP